jgi:hypothetical protein
MLLQWASIAITLTGIIIWFSGSNQGMGYGIFLAGGVMWLILQRAEKYRIQRLSQDQESPDENKSNVAEITRKPRQSDSRN